MANILNLFKTKFKSHPTSTPKSASTNFFSHPFVLAAISGVMVGTSYIPFKGWALFFCYVPLWIASLKLVLSGASYRKIFFTGWITQFVLSLIGFNWIFYTASEFGQLHWSISLGALLLYATLVHIYLPLSIVLTSWRVEWGRRRKVCPS